jgi:hypothetical protein
MSNCKNQKNKTINVILNQNDEWQVISISQYTPQPGLERVIILLSIIYFVAPYGAMLKLLFFWGFQSGNPKTIKLWIPPIWELINYSILIGKHPKKRL